MTERATIRISCLLLAAGLIAGACMALSFSPRAEAASPLASSQPIAEQSKSKSGGLNKDWGSCEKRDCARGE